MRRPITVSLLLATLLGGCSGSPSIEERIELDPILEIVDPALPVARVFILADASGWTGGKAGLQSDEFALIHWQESNGEVGFQHGPTSSDRLLSRQSGSSEWAADIGGAFGTDPAARTMLRTKGPDGAPVERIIVARPIASWPPAGLQPEAWHEIVRLEDLRVAVEMRPRAADGKCGLRLRALDAEWRRPPLPLAIELADGTSSGQFTFPDAVFVGERMQEAPVRQQFATTWLNDFARPGLRFSVRVERAAEDRTVEGIRLVLAPSN